MDDHQIGTFESKNKEIKVATIMWKRGKEEKKIKRKRETKIRREGMNLGHVKFNKWILPKPKI